MLKNAIYYFYAHFTDVIALFFILLTPTIVILLIKSPNFLFVESMANIEKLKFNILDVNGNNYLSYCLDVELHL